MNSLQKMLIRHEGLRLKPYRDTVGKLTIGVGRNLDDVGISEQEALFMLEVDIDRCSAQVLKYIKQNCPDLTITFARHAALVDMCFNMGMPRLRKFKRMLAAIEKGDWDTAALEALNSKWADQVGARAKEIAEMLRTGEYQLDE